MASDDEKPPMRHWLLVLPLLLGQVPAAQAQVSVDIGIGIGIHLPGVSIGIVQDDGFGIFTPGEKIDLASPEVREGARTIRKTIHFPELVIQPPEFFQQRLGKAFGLTPE